MKFLLFFLASLCCFAKEPVVVIGGGVAGLTSALYLARAGYLPIVITGPQSGGLLTQSQSIQNWPGESEISGFELTLKMRKQVEASGAIFVEEELLEVDFTQRPYQIVTKDLNTSKKIQRKADSVLIAMGTTPRKLSIPGEDVYWGKGISNCAVCDGSLYRGKVVGVVGGGDAAVLEALYLSNIAKEVHVFVRASDWKATDKARVQRLEQQKNVHIQFDSPLSQIIGSHQKITHVKLSKGNQVALDGLFLAIGSTPNTRPFFERQLELDKDGFIVVDKRCETSLPGVYALGDIADPEYKQAITASASGAIAALEVVKYLEKKIID
jgi:thioredoxin reductase (NADPH)